MPTRLPQPRDVPPSRFRQFMASTPPWFQWLTLAAMFGAGMAVMILYFWLVKTDPLAPTYPR
jgi:hypothetical protein